jgi:hypothetical protein
MKSKSWKNLLEYKEKKAVLYKEEELFKIEELGAADFNEFFGMFIDHIQINSDENKEKTNTVIGTINDVNIIAFLLKRMVKGNISDFSDMTNQEIVDILNNSSEDVVSQINITIKEFVLEKLLDRIKILNDFAEQMNQQSEVKIIDETQENNNITTEETDSPTS